MSDVGQNRIKLILDKLDYKNLAPAILNRMISE